MAEEYGEVESVSIIKNHHTNKSKGCGFIKFVHREDAQDAFVVSEILIFFYSFVGFFYLYII